MSHHTEAAEDLISYLFSRAETLDQDGWEGVANTRRAWGGAVEALLDQRAGLLEALKTIQSETAFSGLAKEHRVTVLAAIAKAEGQ